MVPKQDLFGDTLSIVRPMAYLDKYEVGEIADSLQLEVAESFCPLANDTKREKVRKLLQTLYKEEPAAKSSLFAALANVRKDYLL
jgi:tRNA 2-thiocytidine biosynthesis protein TtcA